MMRSGRNNEKIDVEAHGLADVEPEIGTAPA